ncbi:MAG: Pls/PosA family non-ribosomal peptide synthetase [Hyphomicrobiaceae bacterium]
MAEASGMALVITEPGYTDRIAGLCRCRILTIADYQAAASRYSTNRLYRFESGVQPDDICYVLFTSGTTGRPKGVVTEHRNVVHFVAAFNEACDTTGEDRVFQGFSLGFDGSVEEIWMAFSNGATLVCGDKTTPRFGADLAEILDQRKITFLSTVPTMLSTLTPPLPSLRQLVVSGEACHSDLVSRWCRPGLAMLNVYGPTETTVNTTISVLQPGKPVTIGRPLTGYSIHILDEEMHPVPAGQNGELFISGPSLSRGYLNQPDVTARSFVDWVDPSKARSSDGQAPAKLRLYKTGDLVRLNGEGELEFLGRIDNQVKLRGFRVELSEIEAVMVEDPAIATAVVKVVERDGMQFLAAYALLAPESASLDRARLLETLKGRLPVYMIPTYLDVMSKFPLLASGKVDRKQLPEPTETLIVTAEAATSGLSPREEKIASVWAKQLRVPSVGPDQDFFTELGGHSLLAAQLVNALRTELGINVPVRDLYANPTVRRLAERIGDAPITMPVGDAQEKATENTQTETALPRRPWTTSALQILYLLAIVPLLAFSVIYVLPVAIDALQQRASVVDLAIRGLAVGLSTWVALLTLAIVAKWLIIGRYRPGRYPIWGSYYIRWWIVSRLQHLSFMSAFNGTPMAPVMWRLMGAKIGSRCVLNASLVYAWDCIRIGNDVSIGPDTHLAGLRIEERHLVIDRIEIEDGCFVGSHSSLGLNVKMEAGSKLDDQSLLPDNGVIPQGASYRGSPAQPADVHVPEGPVLRVGWLRLTAFGALQMVAALVMTGLTLLPVATGAWIIAYLVVNYPFSVSLPAFAASVPTVLFVFALWSAFCKRLVHPRPRPGVYAVYSIHYLQHWLSGLVMHIAKIVGLSIFTTLYLPPWMRLLGARLGRHTEMSTVWSIDPDMVSAGSGVFFADGCMLGGSRTHLGRFELAMNVIGDNSFIGNSAILSTGTGVGSNCLLGVLSAPPHARDPIPDNTDWLGSPGFRLPNRQKVSCFSKEQTLRPTTGVYLQRAVIDALRVVLPGYVLGAIAIASLLVVIAVYDTYGVWGAYTAIPILTWFAIATCLSFVIGCKWLIMGRFKPVVVPLWSRYVWFNELINGLYESLMAPIITNFFGTMFAPVLLRTLGCRIGKRCYVETALFSEFDLVRIGNGVILNAGVVMQNHLFEDRVMKSSVLHIKDRCTVGNMSIILYDTVMEPGARLGQLSLLMKGETMPSGCRWHGIPTVDAK